MAVLITSVQAATRDGTGTGSAVTTLTEPSSYQWGKADLVNSNSGRMMSWKYLKMLTGRVRTLDLEWAYRTFAEVAVVLAAFNHEYVLVTFMDAITGATKTSHFIVNEMSAKAFDATGSGRWEFAQVSLTQATPDA